MRSEHILELIDSKSASALTQEESSAIAEHVSECSACRRAFDAARIAASLMEIRVSQSEETTPPLFFSAKVMTAIRNRASGGDSLVTFGRWWQASFSMVAAMLIMVLGLVAFAVVTPQSEVEAFSSSTGFYTPDTVIMDKVASREFTNEQALQELYNSKNEVKK